MVSSVLASLVRVAIVCTFAVSLPGCGSDPVSALSADYAVLFIGNSLTYSNDLPGMLEDLLNTTDMGDVVVDAVASPNYGLEDHWFDGGALGRIADGGWDVVVMQQGPSATEGRPSLLLYSGLFAKIIRDNGGEPAMYAVWPAATRPFDFPGVADSYATAAEQSNAYLFPVGEAWLAAWQIDARMPLYAGDGFHPTREASFLAALVMYELLTGRDARQLPTSAAGMKWPSGVIRNLQKAAHEANEGNGRVPD